MSRTKQKGASRKEEMVSGFAFHSLLLCVLLILQNSGLSTAREIPAKNLNTVSKELSDMQKPAMEDHLQLYAHKGDNHDHEHIHEAQEIILENDVHDHPLSHMDQIDPALNVFFNLNDLKIGKKMLIYFPIKDPSSSPHLLPREEADSIPFSFSHLPYLLKFFSFSTDSPQAKAMEETLKQCELEPAKGESKFCATSLESMLDSIKKIFGFENEVGVLTTTHLTKLTTLLQNYTFLEAPKQISAPKMVACHTIPYPYAIYYCHWQESENKVFKVLLGGDNGERIDAAAICHMDTSQWDHDHAGFRMLGIKPGSAPVCHFFPADNLVWVQSPSAM
ncbi:unnamed protein product [Ilex paraguariensis]|uniref:BURP domain-containing protein n=1 Tax=Ilex paraguariensis TaxID=185542 RepID=A0ABC8RD30_9AQUA